MPRGNARSRKCDRDSLLRKQKSRASAKYLTPYEIADEILYKARNSARGRHGRRVKSEIFSFPFPASRRRGGKREGGNSEARCLTACHLGKFHPRAKGRILIFAAPGRS